MKILSLSLPQTDDDLELLEQLSVVLKKNSFEYLDMSVEYETDSIRYRFIRQEKLP